MDAEALIIIGSTFLLAGFVKGIIGLGLPTISLAILAIVFDLPAAMTLLLIPSLVTNFVQAITGGNLRELSYRLWPLLLAATVAIWIGARALTRFELSWLTGLLGMLLVVYALVSLAGLKIKISSRKETPAGIVFGSVNGILTGMTGSFVVPGVLYLQALGLPRDKLLQAMGMLFTLSTFSLGLALQSGGILDLNLGLVSVVALVPALAGMFLGQRFGKKIPELRFRQIFFWSILVLGAGIVMRSV